MVWLLRLHNSRPFALSHPSVTPHSRTWLVLFSVLQGRLAAKMCSEAQNDEQMSPRIKTGILMVWKSKNMRWIPQAVGALLLLPRLPSHRALLRPR